MTATRINKGKQTGVFVAQLGNWNLRETEEGRFKVAAIDAVVGKANYAFGVKDGRVNTNDGLDCTRLKEEQPELWKAIHDYLKPPDAVQGQSEPEADPYGDLALGRRQKLSLEQNWRRGLLQFRRIEFEHAAVGKASIWESAVRMLWAGVFKSKITDEAAADALRWITTRNGAVDWKALLQVEQDYYSGKFENYPCKTLQDRLDNLAGATDFENVEEESNATTDLGNGAESETIRSSADRLRSDGTAPSEELPTGEDPFAAFR